jgi:hypothetical protein
MMGFQVHTVNPPVAHPSRRSSNGGPEDAVEMVDIGTAVRTAEDPVGPPVCGLQRAEPVFVNVYGAQESIPWNRFRQPI